MGQVAYCEVWGHLIGTAFLIFKFCIARIYMYVHVDTRLLWCECEGQRMACECRFSLTTVWVARIKFRSSGFFQQAPLATEPSCQSSSPLIISYWLYTTMGFCSCIIFPASSLLISAFMPFPMNTRFGELHRGLFSSGSVQSSFLPYLRNTMLMDTRQMLNKA